MCEKASDQREICQDVFRFTARRRRLQLTKRRQIRIQRRRFEAAGGASCSEGESRQSRGLPAGAESELRHAESKTTRKQQEKTAKTKRRKTKITTNKQKEYEAGNR